MQTITLTAACPAGKIYGGNHLAMALAEGPADGETYRATIWRDAAGNLYAAASFEAQPQWIAAAQAGLSRPAWDAEGIIDMDAASDVQAFMLFSTTPVPADPSRLTVIAGMEGTAALAAMGLTLIEDEL